MLYRFLISSVCLLVGCGDSGLSPTGGTGGRAGTGATGGSSGTGATGGNTGPPPIEVKDFSEFTTFRYTEKDWGFCSPFERTTDAVITTRADGNREFSYKAQVFKAQVFGDSATDECRSSYLPEFCVVDESAGPRELTSSEFALVDSVFSEVSLQETYEDEFFCDPCYDWTFEWDETRHGNYECYGSTITGASLAAILTLLEQLRLGE
jgi:hypothetical protein